MINKNYGMSTSLSSVNAASPDSYQHPSSRMASHRRGPWSQAEDTYLVQLVHTQGALNWVRIAQLIGSRSPKQCRERYHQNLKPSLNHEPISPEEGLQIEQMVGEMGKRWAEIARRLHGRSDNAVKNWWNGSMNRRRRLVIRRSGSSRGSEDFEERAETDHTYSHHSAPYSRSLVIASSLAHQNQHHQMDRSLPSPSTSEASRADSIDGAPSLISDTGSLFSLSPRGATSPAFELPPLHGLQSYSRRSSLAALNHNKNYTPEVDYQRQIHSETDQGEHNYSAPRTIQLPVFQRSEQPCSQYAPRNQQLPSAPPTPIQLPPPQFFSNPVRRSNQRDNRMNLSSLLG